MVLQDGRVYDMYPGKGGRRMSPNSENSFIKTHDRKNKEKICYRKLKNTTKDT